jgi:hypothetical protein
MPTNHNDVLSAFINQTYGSLDKARKADHLADLNPNAKPEHDPDFIDVQEKNLEKEADEELQKQLIAKMSIQHNIRESMSIPSKLHDGQLNQKTEVHNNFKNYDHSLEIHRGDKIGLIRPNLPQATDVKNAFDHIFDDDSNLVT